MYMNAGMVFLIESGVSLQETGLIMWGWEQRRRLPGTFKDWRGWWHWLIWALSWQWCIKCHFWLHYWNINAH